MKGRSGYAAKLQVDIVDPLLFLREVLQYLTDAAAFRKFADSIGGIQSLCCHRLQCSGPTPGVPLIDFCY